MPDTFLQTYLNKQFIKTDDTENISRLKKASTEVAKRLTKKKTRIIPYTLVAIDPLIDENDPVILEIEKIIIAKWTAFKNGVNRTKEKPITYIRVVILEALRLLAKEEEHAALIWHTSRDVISFYNTSKEGETLEAFLQNIGDSTEAKSQEYWNGPGPLSLSHFENSNKTSSLVKAISIDKEKIQEHLKDATLYSGWGGSNPSYTHAGNQSWSNHFISRLSEGLSEEFNAAFSSQTKSTNTVISSIQNELKQPIRHFLSEMAAGLTQGAISNNKRSDLIWWKQALYSPTLRKSYRDFEPLNAAVVMAIDLANTVDPIYPFSVDFLLKETLKDVHGGQIDKKESLSHWLELSATLEENEKALLLPLKEETEGRKSLGTAFANSLNGLTEANIFSETGIPNDASLSLAEFTVWLFHQLQAIKLTR